MRVADQDSGTEFCDGRGFTEFTLKWRDAPMTAGRMLSVLIAVMVSAAALAPVHGLALSDDPGLESLPVHGTVLPAGEFTGTLQIMACTLDAAGQLRISGILNGTIDDRGGVSIPVVQQLFTVPVAVTDPGRTTDVVRLVPEPIAIDPMRMRIWLSPFMVDIDTLPGVEDELVGRPPGL
jgi:hypothetical protein